ncbi:MAG: hypothetical protein FJY66_05885 [Calditrichaeota bacterium]|nr:hypothetical protein [Calditrichota bacterium]
MDKLTECQIARQDYVDNCIYDLLRNVAPKSAKMEWNIEVIGEIRDSMKSWIVDRLHLCNEEDFYPYVTR